MRIFFFRIFVNLNDFPLKFSRNLTSYFLQNEKKRGKFKTSLIIDIIRALWILYYPQSYVPKMSDYCNRIVT
jgi:hypothetical protein